MKYLFITIFIVSLAIHTSGVVLAQATSLADPGVTTGLADPGVTTGVGVSNPVIIHNPIKATNIIDLFQDILDIVMVFAVPVIVFFIIYAGFLYVTARGNEETIKKAHAALLYALIGGLLILGATVLIDVVQGTVDSIR